MELFCVCCNLNHVLQVEMEAIAMSRLGSVYDKVLKLKSRAKLYFKICMQLATSMQPRNFSGESKPIVSFYAQLETLSITENAVKSYAYYDWFLQKFRTCIVMIMT